MDPRSATTDELQKDLCKRVRLKRYQGKSMAFLDLRSKGYGLDRLTLHDPSSRGWPDAGDTTDSIEVAQSWIRRDDKIAEWVLRQVRGENLGLTVEEAIEPFIEAMEKDKTLGPDHGTVVQRRSYLRNQIRQGLGSQRLATMSNTVVQTWLDTMQVTKGKHGRKTKVLAPKNTREAALAALNHMYRHHYPHQVSYPWGRIQISQRAEEMARQRMLVRAGRAHELLEKKIFEPDEMWRILLTARYIDRERGTEKSPLPVWASPNTSLSIALQYGLATRIVELSYIRERTFTEHPGFALIPGTKNESALRLIPVQVSLEPWLKEARQLKPGPIRPEHYLLRTHPANDKRPNHTVYARRMGRVAAAAGLKIEGERSHIFRRTHASVALARGVQPHEIKMFLGHAYKSIFGSATGDYIQTVRTMVGDRSLLRDYLSIPSPAELDAELDAGWEPPYLQKRRKPTGRPKKSASAV